MIKGGGSGARFVVVIVNYNGGAMLRDCVQSAIDEDVPAPQIIVVDNGSADRSIEDLRQNFAALTVVPNSCNAGFARAVNQGLRQAASEFALLLNNDAQLEPGALQAFAEAYDALPQLALAGGQLRYPDGRLQSAFAPLPSLAEEILPRGLLTLLMPHRFRRKSADDKSPDPKASELGPIPVECVLGACLCVRASMLPRLGLLDEDYFFFFEEIEWCQRAWGLGYEVYFLPAASAIHGHGQTANRFRGPSRVEYQRSKLTFFRKTRKSLEYLAVSTVLVLRTLVNAISGAVACLATLFLNPPLRVKAGTYWYLLAWHALLRPASWGLPGKCPDTGRAVAASKPR
jgi:GT2 family glycosyltransferase